MRARRGTTLIELVVSTGLFVVLVGLTSALTIDAWQTYFALRGQSSQLQTLANAGDRITQLAATATSLPTNVTIDGTAYVAGSDTVILSIPSVDETGSAVASSSDTLVYAVTNEGLVELLAVGGGVRRNHSQIVIGPGLSDATFTITQPTGTQVQTTLDLTLTETTALPNRTIQRTEARTVVLRNIQ